LVVYPDRAETPPMSTRYTVTVFIDVDDDYHFGAYNPKHQLAEVDTFTVDTPDGPDGAAEEMFRIGQKGFDDERFRDAAGKAYPLSVRSVSVGDLVKVVHDKRSWFFAVASVGFAEIPEPANPIVELEVWS
jgi:hypothetical protein